MKASMGASDAAPYMCERKAVETDPVLHNGFQNKKRQKENQNYY